MASSYFMLTGETVAGMFPNERTFRVRDHEGRMLAVIVSEDVIDNQGRIRVRLLSRANGISLVKLPGEHLTGAANAISVADGQLVPA